MQVKINNKNYPIRVTLGAQLLFKQDTGKEVSAMEGVEDFGKYLWCCTKSASMADGVEFDIPFDQFLHSFDQDLLDQWEDLQQEYVEKKTKMIVARSEKFLKNNPIAEPQK